VTEIGESKPSWGGWYWSDGLGTPGVKSMGAAMTSVVARSIHDVGLGAGRRGVGAEFDHVEAKEVFGDRGVWRRGVERIDETLVSGGTLAGEEVVDWKPYFAFG
jgi:hypothetical protein